MCHLNPLGQSRRGFVLGCGAIAAGAALPRLAVAQEIRNPLRRYERPTIDEQFSATERRLIEAALVVFYQRFLVGRIADRAWSIATYYDENAPRDQAPRVIQPGTMIADNILRRMKQDPPALARQGHFEPETQHLLLADQLMQMQSICEAETPFPSIEIYAYDADPEGDSREDRDYGDSVARAAVGTMFIAGGLYDLKFDGYFKIGVNRRYLNSSRHRLYTNPVYWAGVIAHELLHNLGHRHPDASDPLYRYYQINLWAYSIQSNGKHWYGEQAPVGCTVQ